ncbi:MAG: hypothetical protein A2855_01295 [Candidatus Liptonbacteria bacterium RIFCSPHIGHO2_01_FULL_57_28]|uniref:Rod shape-determining protein MreD n=1 Tax=Candidatus Liptonbacteria bacterium RIFCSPHIGHO2_01_FULL_57_28 TaxID=1798647 RepID=A0A1G2CB88_9BACT|nr:MAG: hypothetical protein A2855_01295 [Candidatus Liptonbacteria bacterium RIFCSPHIGHO2_01_FULL_57_28]
MSTILGILFAGLAVVFRFVPHPANFTPVGALFIFFAARMKLRWSVFAMAALAATDLVLGTYDPRLMLIVYASFAAMGFLSRAAAQRGGAWRLGFGVLAGSTLFYLTTNFAVWILSPWYTHDLSGLLSSYTLALPFFRNSLLADLLWSGAFFGVHVWFAKRFAAPPPKPVPQPIRAETQTINSHA